MADDTEVMTRAIIVKLKADVTLVDQRVHDAVVDTKWPFIRLGLPSTTPFETSCGNGSEEDITIHTFARGPDRSGINALNKQVRDSMLDDGFGVEGDFYGIDFIRSQVFPDGDDTQSFHGVMSFRSRLIT